MRSQPLGVRATDVTVGLVRVFARDFPECTDEAPPRQWHGFVEFDLLRGCPECTAEAWPRQWHGFC